MQLLCLPYTQPLPSVWRHVATHHATLLAPITLSFSHRSTLSASEVRIPSTMLDNFVRVILIYVYQGYGKICGFLETLSQCHVRTSLWPLQLWQSLLQYAVTLVEGKASYSRGVLAYQMCLEQAASKLSLF